ncbi:MAG: acetyl-CoA acetyltransferase [Gordonia sp. (in: high G+C Gram-positive bacteria)]|uniref:acetyl-CoA acetyltransferase n=1 Tax=Gordonia sp. (in: high G+C Gram-positive bacteria) TaxID=84139 RepID=UPI0039E57F5C
MSDETTAGLDPNTPVVVGVGQASERITDPDYAALGEADLAARAVQAAFADTGAADRVAPVVDVVAAVRSFEKTSPASQSPFGRPDNMPRAVASRTGTDPRRAVEEVSGGQSPQHLVTEFGQEIADGRAHAVVLFGAEVMSTVRNAQRTGEQLDFAEKVGGPLEDRGFGLVGLTSIEEVKHGLVVPTPQYALLENARRHRLGCSREEYARQMGELFAPMTKVAAANPHAADPREHTADELIETSDANRMVAYPYPRRLIARDQVNQAAAVVLMSVRAATEAGIDPSRWVFLHGHADAVEQSLMDRPDLSRGPASTAAVHEALDMAGIGIDDVDAFDLYSCFPIAVSNITEEFGLAPDDPRGLTATGGLPYFGGPGNDYSMHGIAEIVDRVRRTPGSTGLVTANGGMMSKFSVGVYSAVPAPWRPSTSARLQQELDAGDTVPLCRFADGPATIETFTVLDPGRDSRTGLVIGRLADGSRFLSTVHRDDDALFDRLLTGEDPIGTAVWARSSAKGNMVASDEATMDRLRPRRPVGFRDDYSDVRVQRDGQILEITIDRPEARNAFRPKTNDELDEIFDAYFADPDLRVAILTGAGDKAFSAGNDLAGGLGGLTVPENGFGGLTSRRDLPKPVIAAVNGVALGGGLEVALSCHVIVADEKATFGLPEVKVGLVAAAGGLVRLPRVLPPALARDMILTGRKLDADEALRHGLVSRVAPAGGVLDLAREVARQILAASPTSIRESIAVMADSDAQPDTVEAVRDSISVLDRVLVSQDTTEGILAFLQKREPRWTGR